MESRCRGWLGHAKKPGRQYVPLSDAVLESHLADESHVGLYPLCRGDECRLLACDFDGKGWVLDAERAEGLKALLMVIHCSRRPVAETLEYEPVRRSW